MSVATIAASVIDTRWCASKRSRRLAVRVLSISSTVGAMVVPTSNRATEVSALCAAKSARRARLTLSSNTRRPSNSNTPRCPRTSSRTEELRALWDAELAGDTRATVAIKLSAELRLCERHVVDLVARLSPSPGPARSRNGMCARHARGGTADRGTPDVAAGVVAC